MPELPEVETVRRGISPVLEGVTLKDVIVRRPKLRIEIPKDFSRVLTNKVVEKVSRKSKYILLYVKDAPVVILHLGMSGKLLIHPGTKPHPVLEKHDHIIFDTERGDRLIFNDPRRFGLVTFANPEAVDSHPLLASMGPEPLANDFNADYLFKRLSSRKSAIKAALLDQKIIAGLGNIYVCEALFRSGIHPERQAGSLSIEQVNQLVPVIRDVIREAIEAGGSTLKDYAKVDGTLGYFQHQFQVYDRAGESCSIMGCSGVIGRITQQGRSSYFCNACQK